MLPSRTFKPLVTLVAFALAGLVVGASLPQGADASPQPADKMAVAGSTIEIMNAPVVEGMSSEVVDVLSGTIKTSSPTDLVLQVTLECALWTDVTTIGNYDSEAIASVKVWIEVDGQPVEVSTGSGEDDGKVVFCNRAFRMTTTDFDDEDARIDTYLRSRGANAFNWVELNLGSGVHSIVVKAQLDSEVTGTGMAKAAIGKRTLVVEPVKLANDAVI